MKRIQVSMLYMLHGIENAHVIFSKYRNLNQACFFPNMLIPETSSTNVRNLPDSVDISRTADNHLSIYYQNVRGLNTKCTEFYLSVAVSDYPIICCTETWIQSSDLNVPEFWSHNNCVLSRKLSGLLSFASFYNLNQCNGILNINNRLLDLVFSNLIICEVTKAHEHLISEDLYHPPYCQ
nr:unnamed protein product [Callosobruchus chinensis]